VTKREELEAALAQAEAAREYLEAALAKAEAALVKTVTDAAKIDANWAEASAKVDKVRARCRQLRAALVDPDHSERITRSRDRLDTLIKQSGELSKPEATASTSSIQSRDHALRGENKRSQDESRRRKSIRRFINAFATSPRVRETIGLLALVLAYLQYYYFDVQLQIMSLPSPFAFPP
jgi:chromosome segregation ATPase